MGNSVYVLIFFLELLAYHFCVCSQDVPKRDKSKIPLVMNGKFLVHRILITPNIYIWEGDSIKSAFQINDTTNLGGYLKSTLNLDTLSQVFVDEEKMIIRSNKSIEHKQYFDFDCGTAMPYDFKSNKKHVGYFAYNIPLVSKDFREMVEGKFNFPEMRLLLKRIIQVPVDRSTTYYFMIILAQMTHRIEFEDHTKYVPLIYPNK